MTSERAAKPVGGTFLDWVAWYEERTGTRARFHPTERIVFDPERGFVSWWFSAEDTALHLGKMAGDGRFWERVVLEEARRAGCTRVQSFTRRPKLWMRRYGAKIKGYVMEREV